MTFASYPHGVSEAATLLDKVGDGLPGGVQSPQRLRKAAQRKEIDRARLNPFAQLPLEFRIEHCDFKDLEARTGDLTGKVHVLLTDPPWIDAYDRLLKPFAEFAARVLASDGLLLCYSGGNTLPDFLACLRTHLTYQWNIVCLNSPRVGKGDRLVFRGSRRRDGMMRICHRNVLVFSKGSVWKPFKSPEDVVAEDEPRELIAIPRAGISPSRSPSDCCHGSLVPALLSWTVFAGSEPRSWRASESSGDSGRSDATPI